MPKPKRQCHFNIVLKQEFPFIRKGASTSDVICEKCQSHFSISNLGRAGIIQHLRSDKHKKCDDKLAQPVAQFFRSNVLKPKERELAASEGMWVYHTVRHNHTFRSMDCTGRLIQNLYDPKFSCARTKTEAILKRVLCPFATSELLTELRCIDYLTIIISSMHQTTGLQKSYRFL